MFKNLSWRKWVGASVIVSAIAVGAPLAAHAGTGYQGYSVTIGRLGGHGYSASQTKAISHRSGDITVRRVGDNRSVAAVMQKSDRSAQGEVREHLHGGYTATLPNRFTRGTSVRLKMWGNALWIVAVQVDGTWRSN